MSVKMYYNPACSTCRKTLALLHDKGVEPDIVEYLNTPPTAAELKEVLGLLGLGPRDILRTKEAAEEGIDPGLNGDALIDALVAHPRALQRPIVISGGEAILGRPPESVLDIL